MSREEAREKGWNTFRKNMLQYADEHPGFSLTDFVLQRLDTAYNSWREARENERRYDFKKARRLYMTATESMTQAEKLVNCAPVGSYSEMLNAEYLAFAIHRDPVYRENLRELMPVIKAKPAILQTELYESVQISKPEASYTLYFAEKEGLIRREKKGRSYQLYFERDKPPDEPLLKVQDDEIDTQRAAEQEVRARQGCSWFLSVVLWGGAFLGMGAVAGVFGCGIVVAAFIAWKIIKRKLPPRRPI